MNEKLKEKVKESLSSVLPITLIVLVLSVTLVPMEIGTLALFLTGAVLLIVGMGFFQLGAEMSMTPLGEGVGKTLAKREKVLLVVLVAFALGTIITVHKSKGLEYPLVYLPFAVTARKVDKRNRSFFDYADEKGERRLDLSLSDEAMAAVEEARIEEDLRLLYVALTRARHFLWLGVAAQAARKAGENTLHESALGYLLTGGEKLPAEQLLLRWQQVAGSCDAIYVGSLAQPDACTVLDRIERRPELRPAPVFVGEFERDWSVGSFTSLTRQIGAVAAAHVPQRALEETLLEDGTGVPAASPLQTGDAPWHRFPRGSVPGNFLHEQLEWMGGEGFDSVHEAHFDTRLAARCERAGTA